MDAIFLKNKVTKDAGSKDDERIVYDFGKTELKTAHKVCAIDGKDLCFAAVSDAAAADIQADLSYIASGFWEIGFKAMNGDTKMADIFNASIDILYDEDTEDGKVKRKIKGKAYLALAEKDRPVITDVRFPVMTATDSKNSIKEAMKGMTGGL